VDIDGEQVSMATLGGKSVKGKNKDDIYGGDNEMEN
jgi:hypothetical protein